MRKYARRKMPHFMEVYLDCSIDVCAQRDFKGHYRRAFNGEYHYCPVNNSILSVNYNSECL